MTRQKGTGPGRRRRTQAERSDQAIGTLRSVAMELLLEVGITGFNLSVVGDRAGYSRGIVHYHFGSKEALLADLLEGLLQSGKNAFSEVSGKGIAGLVEILTLLERADRSAPSESLARVLLLNEAASSVNPGLNDMAVAYNQAIRSAIETLIEGDEAATKQLGITAGEFAILYLATIRGIHNQWLAERDAFDISSALQAYSRTLSAFTSAKAVR